MLRTLANFKATSLPQESTFTRTITATSMSQSACSFAKDDVWTLFLLLDSEQKGVLELDEFVSLHCIGGSFARFSLDFNPYAAL